MNNTRLIVLLAALSAAGPAGAANYAGADPFEFLFLPAGARQAALGGAFAAGRNDPNVLSYNPAGLGYMERSKVSFSANSHFFGVSHSRIAAGFRSGLGLAYDQVKYGDIRRTTLADPAGDMQSNFQPVSRSLGLGFGTPLTSSIGAGIALHRIEERLDDETASAWAADFGVQALVLEEPNVIIGLAVQHLGSKAEFQSARESLPLNLKGGAAVGLPVFGRPVAVILDINHVPQQKVFMSLGLEATFLEIGALRAGYNRRNEAGANWSIGAGFQLPRFSFDFAFAPYGELGSAAVLTLGWRWGE